MIAAACSVAFVVACGCIIGICPGALFPQHSLLPADQPSQAVIATATVIEALQQARPLSRDWSLLDSEAALAAISGHMPSELLPDGRLWQPYGGLDVFPADGGQSFSVRLTHLSAQACTAVVAALGSAVTLSVNGGTRGCTGVSTIILTSH